MSSIIFGLTFLFSKRALTEAGPLSLISFRFLTAFTVMTVLIAFKVIKVRYKNKPLRWLLVLALFEPVIYFIFETYGLMNTAASVSGLMISLIPIAVTILGAYFLKEIPSIKQTCAIITSVAGVVLIALMDSSNSTGTSLLGVLLLLGAVFSAAAFSITSRKLSNHFTPFEITYFMVFLGTICFNGLLFVQLMLEKSLSSYFIPLTKPTFITSILYLGIMSSIIAYFLINYSLSKLQASKTSVFANISTIVSIIGGVIFLKESFYFYHIIGSILILLGVWGTNYFKGRTVKREERTSETLTT
jgi:drug/metabolite transporter (DMT)-like permease